MPVNFPSSPTTGEIYSAEGRSWRWTGSAWIAYIIDCSNPMKSWTFQNYSGTTYRNGDPIPEVTDATAWAGLTTGAWCYFSNSSVNGRIYGKLYNWYAINDPRGFAPVGYRVPTDTDWSTLRDCLGGEPVAGGKMKTTGILQNNDGLWDSPNTDATNSSRFNGLPGGFRNSDGGFSNNTISGYWWSSTESNTNNAWHYDIDFNFGILFRGGDSKVRGYSVRLMYDI
jgi:uncharacterized protein (TIGR02145 family)